SDGQVARVGGARPRAGAHHIVRTTRRAVGPTQVTKTMKLAVQIYSVRNAGDFETQLKLVRAAGFEWIESVATHGLAPAQFAQTLADHGVKLCSMHASLELLETRPEHVVDACRAANCRLVVMPWLPRSELSAMGHGWAAMGARLAGISAALSQHGLQLG